MSDDRRMFLKKAAGAAAALASADTVLAATTRAPGAEPPSAAAIPRAPGISRFGLELEGAMAGMPRSVDGGDVSAVIVEEGLGGGGPFDPLVCAPRKHIGNLTYQPLTIECALGMSDALYGWIGHVLECRPDRRNGAVVTADAAGKEIWRLQFYEAWMTQVTFPAADLTSKDPAYMTLKVAPEMTRREEATGKMLGDCVSKTTKAWLPSNFRLTIDGLDCTRVSKVGEFTVTQQFIDEGPFGERLPGKLQVPNLAVTLPEAYAKTFYDWHKDFLIDGHSDEGSEKVGKLDFLSPTGTPIFTVSFQGLGIVKLAMDKMDTGVDGIKRVTAEMYCQAMRFEAGKGLGSC